MKLKERNDIILTRLLACSETATTGDVVVRVCPTCLGGGGEKKKSNSSLTSMCVSQHGSAAVKPLCYDMHKH